MMEKCGCDLPLTVSISIQLQMFMILLDRLVTRKLSQSVLFCMTLCISEGCISMP